MIIVWRYLDIILVIWDGSFYTRLIIFDMELGIGVEYLAMDLYIKVGCRIWIENSRMVEKKGYSWD